MLELVVHNKLLHLFSPWLGTNRRRQSGFKHKDGTVLQLMRITLTRSKRCNGWKQLRGSSLFRLEIFDRVWRKGLLHNRVNDLQWGPCALHHLIQSSMEAILACHPAVSTEWLAGWQIPVYYDVCAPPPPPLLDQHSEVSNDFIDQKARRKRCK